jgi:hypothetical protein
MPCPTAEFMDGGEMWVTGRVFDPPLLGLGFLVGDDEKD